MEGDNKSEVSVTTRKPISVDLEPKDTLLGALEGTSF